MGLRVTHMGARPDILTISEEIFILKNEEGEEIR